MIKDFWLLGLICFFILSGCGKDEFQGRFIGPDGESSFEFQSDGTVEIQQADRSTITAYEYDAHQRKLSLSASQNLASDTFTVSDAGHLIADDITLTRAIDYQMLEDSTWIGHQGQYSFALTFTQSENGMETLSELVTYDPDEMTYISQTDDSITRLTRDKLLLDLTQYTVSEVTPNSFRISIGGNSMVLHKHAKHTDIDIRDNYQLTDEQS